VTHFNHANQIVVNYVFVALLVLLLVVVNYQFYTPPTSPLPWYIALRFTSRLSISGWKISNLQYKTSLVEQI